MNIPGSFTDLLVLLGSPVFIGVVISVLFARWAWFVAQPNNVKFWLVGATSILLPIISRALQLYIPEGIMAFLADWYPTVAVGLGVWVSSQVWNNLFGLEGAISRADHPEEIKEG